MWGFVSQQRRLPNILVLGGFWTCPFPNPTGNHTSSWGRCLCSSQQEPSGLRPVTQTAPGVPEKQGLAGAWVFLWFPGWTSASSLCPCLLSASTSILWSLSLSVPLSVLLSLVQSQVISAFLALWLQDPVLVVSSLPVGLLLSHLLRHLLTGPMRHSDGTCSLDPGPGPGGLLSAHRRRAGGPPEGRVLTVPGGSNSPGSSLCSSFCPWLPPTPNSQHGGLHSAPIMGDWRLCDPEILASSELRSLLVQSGASRVCCGRCQRVKCQHA